MYKLCVFAVFSSIVSYQSHAQAGIEAVLEQVEQNNQMLIALKSKVESKQLALKSGNNLPDPEVGVFYLPFGDNTRGDYTEYQITQSFEFPSVYSARNQLIKAQGNQFELQYELSRKSILSEAKGYCLEIIYLNKLRAVEAQRIDQSRIVLEQIQTLSDKEQVGILELNKAKLAWMQDRFKLEHIDTRIENAYVMLTSLNGGNEVEIGMDHYLASLDLMDVEQIWNEKLAGDPDLGRLNQQKIIASHQLKLSRNSALPNLTAGFNSQGVSGERFSGIYAGISIPLWSKRNTVKSAQSNVQYQEAFVDARLQSAYTAFEKNYKKYQHKLEKFKVYEETLAGLNTEDIILKAFEIGELSFLEYYSELQFYREAYNTMLEMQYQLYQAQNELLKHQL